MRHKRLVNKDTNRNNGLVGLELLAIVAILVLAVSIALPLFLSNKPSDRLDITHQRMQAIKDAIVGDQEALYEKKRTSFGFVGDLGVLPGDLSELVDNTGGRPNFRVSNNIWFGWRGPYVTADTVRGSVAAGDIVYTILYDAWGNQIAYSANPAQFPPGAPAGTVAMLRSAGQGGTFDPVDNITDDLILYISENETKTYVSGYFKDRAGNPVEEGVVTIYFPNGTAVLDSVQVTPSVATPTQYNSQTDTVSDITKRKIPIGSRYMVTQQSSLPNLAVLNGGPLARVDFISADEPPLSADLMELTFLPSDKSDYTDKFPKVFLSGNDAFEPIDIPGSDPADPKQGYIRFTDGNDNPPLNTAVVKYGKSRWDDYRIEANVLHGDGYKYQLFYRMNGMGYAPLQPDDSKIEGTGYGFEFDPHAENGDDYAYGNDNGAGIGGVFLRIWKYRSGSPRSLIAEREFTKAEFQAKFSYPVLWRAHQISITVQNSGDNIAHYILINGKQVFDTDIVDYAPTGISNSGYGAILAERNTVFRMYHILVHQVPPQAEFPFVWWSFEEGVYTGNDTVYGFGYLNNVEVMTGTISNSTNIERTWHMYNFHGQALFFHGVNDSNVDFGDVFDFGPSDSFTISTWVRILSVPPVGSYVVLCKRGSPGNSDNRIQGWRLRIEPNGAAARAAFIMNRSGTGHGGGQGNQPRELHVANTETPIVPDTWYHVCVTYNGSGLQGNTTVPAERLRIYVTPISAFAVDESPNHMAVAETLRANTQLSNDDSFLMGTLEDGTNPFRGYIDELKILTYTVAPDKIIDLFNKK